MFKRMKNIRFIIMKFTIKTIGCKVNTYESTKLMDELVRIGFEYVDVDDKESYKELDFYIVNTCSVTKIADKKSRQMLHMAKKINPNVKVIAMGCMVNSLSVGTKDENNNLDGVDYLIPNEKKDSIPEFLLSIYKDINRVECNNSEIKNNVSNRIRAFIKIQDGCNQYCTYCIIPFLRGNIKSRKIDDIIKEVKEKAASGVKEIVLTGIHLSSFGLDDFNKSYESEGAIDIARKNILKVVEEIAKVDEIDRIRLGSLEPRIISESFLQDLISEKNNNKFCANFCLSLQSGCDATLKRMNRHYTTADFENACNLIRKIIPYATITTDVIVGFPGETKEDFLKSLDFVKRMRFYNPNIFPYSKRQGTKAAVMEGQLTNDEKHNRSVSMINECEKISKEIEKEYFEKYPEKAKDVLIEEYIEFDNVKYGIGYTREYVKVKIPS